MEKTTHTPLTSTRDFRLYLQEVLVGRCKTNPAYSLRAFAKQLKVEPSFLSKILSGKRKVTTQLIERLTPRLGLDPAAIQQFSIQSPVDSSAANYRDLTVDQFTVIADWYHYAILELALVSGFKCTPAYISKALGVTPIEAKSAIERLTRLEMIELDSKGKLTQRPQAHTTVSTPFTSVAFKKLQKQLLEQAILAMDEVEIESRDQSSLTMAIDPALMPEAKAMIKKFRRDLCVLLQKNGPTQKEVYQLSVSLFPAKQNLKGVKI